MPFPTYRATLATPAGTEKLWLTSIGPDASPVAMWAASDGGILLTQHDSDGSVVRQTLTASPGLESLDHLQPLPDGRWVMVDARATWSMIDGVTRNAVLVAPDGEHLARECLGDAIDHLVATRSGRLWTGYWDEATTGDTQAQLIGASGLARWSDGLQQTWTYDGAGTGSWILTCDALTLDGERALAAIDAVRRDDDEHDNRVLVIDDGSVRDHAGGVAEVWGVLAAGDDIALLGSTDDDLVVTVGRLGDGALVGVRTTRLQVDPDTLTARVCRGATLHLFQGDVWSTVALADLLEAADG